MKISGGAKKAILIGGMCSISYFAVYIARNILSTVTPYLLAAGLCNEDLVGLMSSAYFITYALGQLINGAIGDRIKARYMIGAGLLLAGICNFLFPYIVQSPTAAIAVYGASGFFLAMIYGPMTKLVADNTEPIYATRCSLGYTFASFFGSPVAGALAAFLAWQNVFTVGSAFLILMALVSFFSFLAFEKQGKIRYQPREKESKNSTGGVRLLVKRGIVKFAVVAALTGVVRTSVVFWFPTYLSQALGFSESDTSAIFSVATLVISASAFIAVFVYERIGYDMDKTMLLMFAAAALFFLGTYLIPHPWVNIVLLTLAIMAGDGASTMLWSRYCPSLSDTGMVSGATGFLDFISYMAAALANALFGNAAATVGWGVLVLVWCALMVAGVLLCLPYQKLRRGTKEA